MTDFRMPPAAHDHRARGATSVHVDPRLGAALAYLFGPVSGVVLLVAERRNLAVRFHAAQSLLLTMAVLAAWAVLAVLPTIPLFGLLAQAAGVLLWMTTTAMWLYLMVAAYHAQPSRVPVIGALAERLAVID